jgi:hypothetical protein
MGASIGRPRGQSLGAWLAALRPGDPCPWCGGRLKAGSKPADLGASALGPDRYAGGGAALVCGQCGGEVDPEDVASDVGCTLLDHAA